MSCILLDIVAYLFKAGIVEPGETAIARQQLSRHATIPESLPSTVDKQQWRNCWKQSSLRGPCQGHIPRTICITTKFKPSAWGYNWATLFLGDINTETWPSRFGEYRIWECNIWSRVPPDSDPRMTVLARISSGCKRQNRLLIREGAVHQQTRSCLTVTNIWAPDGSWHQDRLAGWLSVVI
jgi:hypothetical protein